MVRTIRNNIILALFGTSLIVGFQNCGGSNLSSSNSGASNEASQSALSKKDVDALQVSMTDEEIRAACPTGFRLNKFFDSALNHITTDLKSKGITLGSLPRIDVAWFTEHFDNTHLGMSGSSATPDYSENFIGDCQTLSQEFSYTGGRKYEVRIIAIGPDFIRLRHADLDTLTSGQGKITYTEFRATSSTTFKLKVAEVEKWSADAVAQMNQYMAQNYPQLGADYYKPFMFSYWVYNNRLGYSDETTGAISGVGPDLYEIWYGKTNLISYRTLEHIKTFATRNQSSYDPTKFATGMDLLNQIMARPQNADGMIEVTREESGKLGTASSKSFQKIPYLGFQL